MESKILVICFILFVLGIGVGFGISKINLTGNVVSGEEYSYTKAVCNENKCVDVLVDCRDGEVLSLKPMSEVIDVGNGSLRVNNSELC